MGRSKTSSKTSVFHYFFHPSMNQWWISRRRVQRSPFCWIFSSLKVRVAWIFIIIFFVFFLFLAFFLLLLTFLLWSILFFGFFWWRNFTRCLGRLYLYNLDALVRWFFFNFLHWKVILFWVIFACKGVFFFRRWKKSDLSLLGFIQLNCFFFYIQTWILLFTLLFFARLPTAND